MAENTIGVKFRADVDTQVVVQKINVLVGNLKKSLGVFGKGINLLDEAAVNREMAIINKSLDTAVTSSNKAKTAMSGFSDEVGKAVKSGNFLGKAFLFNQVAQGIDQATRAVAQLSKPFVDLDTATARIRTLGGAAKEISGDLREISLEMSKDVPISAAALQTATYDALSAGINATKEDIVAFVGAASRLAVGGGEQVGNTVNLLSSLINAYGESAQKTAEYSDILFTTVNLGKTTIPELNASLSQVIPTASAMGFSLRDVGASLALMTANGVPTAQATTKLNQLLIEIQKPGAALATIFKNAGISVESIGKKIKSGDVIGAFTDLQGAFKKAGVTATQAFSSSEAGAAFNVLTKDISKLQGTMDSFNSSAGATDAAFADMADSMANKTAQMQANLETKIISIIDKLGGFGTGLALVSQNAQTIAPFVTTFAALGSVIPTESIKSFATAILSKLVPGLITGTGAQRTFNLSVLANPYTAAIASVIVLTAAIKGLSSMLHETAQEQLEQAGSEKKLLDEQAKTINKQKEMAQSSINLVKSFEREGEAALKNTDLMSKLAKTYPKAIDTSKSYAENLRNLKTAAENSTSELGNLDAKLSELAIAKLELEIKTIRLSTNAIKEEMENLFTDALVDDAWQGPIFKAGEKVSEFLFGTSGTRGRAEDYIKKYTDEIYNAASSDDVKNAGLELQLALSKGEGEFAGLTDEQKANLMQKTEEIIKNEVKLRDAQANKIKNSINEQLKLIGNEESVVKLIAKQYNKTEEEVRAMIAAQKESEDTTTSQTAAVVELSEAWAAATKTVSDNIQKQVANVNELRRQLDDKKLTVEQRKELQKKYNDELTALKKNVVEKQRLDKIDEQTQIRSGLKIVAAKDEYESIKKSFDLAKKVISNKLEDYTITAETLRLQEGREQSVYDEIALQEQKIKALEEEKQKLIEIYGLKFNTSGQVVDVGFRIPKGKDKNDILQEIDQTIIALNNSIRTSKNGSLNLQMKLDKSDEELQKQLKELERKQLEFDIEIGVKTNRDLIDALEKDLADIKDKAKAVDGAQSKEEIKQAADLAAKKIDIEQKLNQLKKSERDKQLADLQDAHEKELEEIQSRLDAEKSLYEASINTVNDALNIQAEGDKDSRLKTLENQKEQELITEDVYNQQKEEIEREHQNRLKVIQEAARGTQLEAERQQTLKLLEEKAARLQAEQLLLDPEKDKEKYDQISAQLGALNDQIQAKGDILKAYSGELQLNLAETFTNLLGGNEEGLKNSARSMFALIGGILKKQASALAVQKIMEQLALTPGGLAAFLVTPLITGLVNVAISKILDPIISSITSFSTGGPVSEPTIAIVGDASKSKKGSNMEWIFRNDQLNALMTLVLSKFSKQIYKSLDNLIGQIDSMTFDIEPYDISLDKYKDMFKINDFSLENINKSMMKLNDSIEALPKSLKDNLSFDKLIGIAEQGIEIKVLKDDFDTGKISKEAYDEQTRIKELKIRSFAGGSDFLYRPELALIGDAGANNPEIVLNSPQLESIIARVGERSNTQLIERFSRIEDLLKQLLNKDTNVYMNTTKVTDEVNRENNRRKFG
jgi:TP901 family phage tail tape measure protein